MYRCSAECVGVTIVGVSDGDDASLSPRHPQVALVTKAEPRRALVEPYARIRGHQGLQLRAVFSGPNQQLALWSAF